VVKFGCLTITVPLILMNLREVEAFGMDGVAVKCIDIIQNTDCEGRRLYFI
jgi:hypothetical protein